MKPRRLAFDGLEDRRLLSNGPLDPSFGTAGQVVHPGGYFGDVALESAKILVQGFSGDVGDVGELLRYNADGTLDTSFGTNGVLSPASGVQAFALAGNGDILVAGKQGSGAAATVVLSEYDANGAGLISGFGTAGQMATDLPYSGLHGFERRALGLSVQPNGGSILVGSVNGPETVLERLTESGAVDASFGTNGSATIKGRELNNFPQLWTP